MHRTALGRLYAWTAGTWLILPGFLAYGLGSIPGWASVTRVQPVNNSYDAMFIAAAAGLGITALVQVFAMRRSAHDQPLPLQHSWRNAFNVLVVAATISTAASTLYGGAVVSGGIWLVVAIGQLVLTAMVARAELREGVSFATGSADAHPVLRWVASIVLVILAAGFLLFPVFQPWSGPPEPFVRWHPYTETVELVWRGVFLSFAIGMIAAAQDPLRRHRTFLLALVFSGLLHGLEMAVDNLTSMHSGHSNGNVEHLYGDILGWIVIAVASLVALALSVDRRRAQSGVSAATPAAA